VSCRSRWLLVVVRGRRAARVSKRLRALERAGLAGIVAAFVADCGGDHGPLPEQRRNDVAAVIKGLDNPFFATMRDGLIATARQRGLKITVDAALGLEDTTGQASALESLAADHDGCYIVNPIDRTNLIESLATVVPGTPIVNIDSPIDQRAARADGVGISAYIGTDNVAAGRLAADGMARFVGPGARVAVVTGIPGDSGSDARAKGFIAGAHGRFTVVGTVAADFDRGRARLAASKLLHGQPRVDGFFAVNDEMALGVGEAVATQGRSGQVPVIGMDGIREALGAVKRGALSATVAQYPYTIGQLGVEACLAALRRKALPATVDAPVQLVTARNAALALAKLPLPVERFADPLAGLVRG
jgi:ABC-type sugar transport system substrate-binding protein